MINLYFAVGTGTNACYMEQLGKVHQWDGDSEDPREVSHWISVLQQTSLLF